VFTAKAPKNAKEEASVFMAFLSALAVKKFLDL
jgi:hypothetical protein